MPVIVAFIGAVDLLVGAATRSPLMVQIGIGGVLIAIFLQIRKMSD